MLPLQTLKLVFWNLNVATAGELVAEKHLMCTHANACTASASMAAGQTCVGQHGLAMNVVQRGRHEASLLVSVCPHANEATSEAETRGHLMQKYETKTIWIILLHVTVWPNIYPHTHKQATQTHTGQNSLFLMEKKKSREKCLPLQFIHFWNKGKTLEMSKMGFVCSEIYLLKF